jgi:hypothetical protein
MVYRARVATVPTNDFGGVLLSTLLVPLFGIIDILIPHMREPRYRVLVRRLGSHDEMGVREAHTRSEAARQLAEVEALLRGSDESQVRDTLGLDF